MLQEKPGELGWHIEEAMGWRSETSWFDTRQWQEIYLLSNASRQCMGSTHTLFSENQDFFLQVQDGRNVKLTTYSSQCRG